tara:strand:- start:1430 stop:1738 length:309 start_codon:yes stop_codon:yes gene_type:complete
MIALNFATLLGGVSAMWFLWDKRKTISAWIKIKSYKHVNPLTLSDDEFLFFNSIRNIILTSRYLPKDKNEESTCKSLVNAGVLAKRGEFYVLTSAGRVMARA